MFVTLQAPITYYGYYNVDAYKKVVYINPEYPIDNVLITYSSLNQVDSENYLVPVHFEKTIAFYINWKYKESRRSTPLQMIIRAEKLYYNEKRKAKMRNNPIILEETIDLLRGNNPRP